jgi:DnaJ-class molecular chaperone
MNVDDPYRTLGLARGASEDDVRRAYRRLAKQYHPDLNKRKEAEERFKAVHAAYAILSDPEKRARFDRGEIDGQGNERPRNPFEGFAARGAGGGGGGGGSPFGGADEFEDLFANVFGGNRGRRQGARSRGADLRSTLSVDFLEAMQGAKKRVALAAGRTVDLAIPAGVADGQVLRLAGQGAPGQGGGAPGDALVEVKVRPHPHFRRVGDDIHLDVPVTLGEAVLGGRITVPTLTGPVTMTVPKGADSGMKLRLKGKGVGGRGDQYAILQIVLAGAADAELERFVAEWSAKHPADPRRSLLSA